MSEEKIAKGTEGVVEEVLPKKMFFVRLPNGNKIRAVLTVKSARGIVKLKKGDQVIVKVSDFDPTRGRILSKK